MLTLTDMFCGAGGSSTGATQIPDVEVIVAANHWQLAIDTHAQNHPTTDHRCADLSQVEVIGSRNGHAKLTEADVREIRRRARDGELHRIIAADYGVSRSRITTIANGRDWRHVA